MKLNNLVALYRNMTEQKLDRVKFPYRLRNLRFGVFFYIGGIQFEIILVVFGAYIFFGMNVYIG